MEAFWAEWENSQGYYSDFAELGAELRKPETLLIIYSTSRFIFNQVLSFLKIWFILFLILFFFWLLLYFLHFLILFISDFPIPLP